MGKGQFTTSRKYKSRSIASFLTDGNHGKW